MIKYNYYKYTIYYDINIYVKNITCLSRGKSLVESSIFLIKYNRSLNNRIIVL